MRFIDNEAFHEPRAEARIMTLPIPPMPDVSLTDDGHLAGNHSVLTRQQEHHLFLQLRHARDQADAATNEADRTRWTFIAQDRRERLVRFNLRLAVKWAYKLANLRSVPLDDRLSLALLGLIRAIDAFDVDRGNKFSTYASRAILSAVINAGNRAKRHMGVQSLDHPVGGTVTTQDLIPDDHAVDPTLNIEIADLLDHLTAREQSVIRARFGIGETPRTLEAIGCDIGVSRERVRQIERKATAKLAALTP